MNKTTIILVFLNTVLASCHEDINLSPTSSINVEKNKPHPKVIVQDSILTSGKKILPLVQIVDPLEFLELNNVLASTGSVGMPNDSYGTGVCVTHNQVLTAFHVVNDGKDNPFPNGIMEFFTLDESGLSLYKTRQVEIRYLRHSKPFDLALYEIVDKDFTCRVLPLANDGPRPGTLVRRFGFNDGWKWTLGVFKGKDVQITIAQGASGISDRDKYEMPVFFGASGGPVLSMSGLLLGIVVQLNQKNPATITNKQGQSGFEHSMYTLAIPIEKVKLFLNEAPTPKSQQPKKKK